VQRAKSRLGKKTRYLKCQPTGLIHKTYDGDNVHLTHVGCNLAKSAASTQNWEDFLDVLRTG
jgi:hypothetical protein